MHRIAGRLALFIALVMWIANVAWASDIACPQHYRPRCDVSAPANASCGAPAQLHPHGRQLICEYAMLNETYERIYAEQQYSRSAGTLRKSDLDAWRSKRDACTTVRCLDQLFANWRSVPNVPVMREAPPRQPMVAESRPPSRRAGRADAATRAVASRGTVPLASGSSTTDAAEDLDPPAPSFEPTMLSLRDSLQPLPPVGPRTRTAVGAAPASLLPGVAWLPWFVALLAGGGGFYWLVIRKQAGRYLDAAFASASAGLSWLKTLPLLAFVLVGLALLNGVLLVVLLGGWGVHLPGIN